MSIFKNFNIMRSVSARLFCMVFSLYLIIAITVTVIHLTTEYYYEKSEIEDELEIFKDTFRASLADALWQMDRRELLAIISGMIKIPSVSGVQIKDHTGKHVLESIGTVFDREGNVIVLRNADGKITPTEPELFTDLFFYSFTVHYKNDSREEKIGEATIYSSSNIIFQRLKVSFFFIVINSLIKSLFLWLIFMMIARKVLRKPLRELTSAVQRLDFDNLEPISINVNKSRQDEIGVLGNALETAVKNIISSRDKIQSTYQELGRHRNHLQEIVEEKTYALRKRNEQLLDNIIGQRQSEKQIKTSLKEKEILLQEIHHRVKNNLAVILSLLKLQANSMQDDRLSNVLKDCQNRVHAMSLIHETLYESENLANIDIKSYLPELSRIVFQNYAIGDRVNLKIDIDSIIIGVKQATPLGLIINELISNSLKYAFPDNREGEIMISLQKKDDQIELIFEDNGIGIPENFDWDNTKTLGLNLVKMLGEGQLCGAIELNREHGTCFVLKFVQEDKTD
ncbi:hypothetical protein KKA14_01745 [bacterium]|nr:hypothetical protein [bacterium]